MLIGDVAGPGFLWSHSFYKTCTKQTVDGIHGFRIINENQCNTSLTRKLGVSENTSEFTGGQHLEVQPKDDKDYHIGNYSRPATAAGS
jgi:hypothetical protein